MKTIIKTTLFLFIVAQSAMAQDTIQSTLVVGDSALIGQALRVEGKTMMRDDATASRDLKVEGQLFVVGTSNLNGLNLTGLNLADNLGTSTFLVVDGNGIVKSFGMDALTNMVYGRDCGVGAVIPNPVWNNGENKVYLPCDVRVGVNTSTPTQSLDVRGNAYIQSGIRVGNILSSSFANPALFEGERSYTYVNPFIRMAVKLADGSTETRFKVDANGTVWCTEVHVRPTTAIPDYVFKSDYKLMPLAELRTFVNSNSHLPNIPSEAEILENGTDMSEMQMKLLEKVEELTLYILELDAKNAELQKQIDALKGDK